MLSGISIKSVVQELQRDSCAAFFLEWRFRSKACFPKLSRAVMVCTCDSTITLERLPKMAETSCWGMGERKSKSKIRKFCFHRFCVDLFRQRLKHKKICNKVVLQHAEYMVNVVTHIRSLLECIRKKQVFYTGRKRRPGGCNPITSVSHASWEVQVSQVESVNAKEYCLKNSVRKVQGLEVLLW